METTVKTRAAEIGHRAAEAVDAKRDRVARAMHTAAAALHDRADSLPSGAKVARAAHVTAGAMETAAAYVRDQDVQAMVSDVGRVVKRHPGAVLLTALAVGYLLTRSLTRH